jgi:hypothetical protein
MYLGMGHVFQPFRRTPAIVFDFAKKFITDHHTGSAGRMMMEVYKTFIAEFLPVVGHFFGHHMGMNIYAQQRCEDIKPIGYDYLICG